MIEVQATSDPEANSRNIQATIDALDAGDVIVLQPGMKYPYAKTHILRPNTRIYGGSGDGRATLIAPAGFSDPVFQNAGYTASARDRVDSGIGLYGLIIVGGGAKGVLNPKANPLILLEGVSDSEFVDVLIERCPGDGFYVTGHKKGSAAFQITTGLRLTGVIVRGADRNCFCFVSLGNSQLYGCEGYESMNAILDFETNQLPDSLYNITVIDFKGITGNGLGGSWGTHEDDSQLDPEEATWNQVSNLTFYGCDIQSKRSAYNACQSATNVSLTACKGLSTDANGANFHVMTINPNSKQRNYHIERCDLSAPNGEALSLANVEGVTLLANTLHDSKVGFKAHGTTGTQRGSTFVHNGRDTDIDPLILAAAS